MQLLKLAQLKKAKGLSKEQKCKLAREIDIHYCIPNETYKHLDAKSYSGYNCLHIAAMKLDSYFINEFVNSGADLLKQGTKNGKTSLHVAVDVKRNTKKRKICEINGKLRNSSTVSKLLLSQVKSDNAYSPKCNNGVSHLHIASMFNCVKAVEFFVKNGEPINQTTNANADWPLFTPLHFAMRYSSVEAAELLLVNGADLFINDAEGKSPLHILISRLLNILDYINIGDRAICLPSCEEELKRIETIVSIVLKSRGGDGAIFLDHAGLTTFHVACTMRDSSIAASFLNDRLDLNVAVNDNSRFWPGWTPLHFAACASVETVVLLVQRGAGITVKNKNGRTPLDMCLKRYTPAIVHSIISTRDEFKNILLSDNSKKLLDLILVMNDLKSFKSYLRQLTELDIRVCPSSPVWPGYSLLHLALSMNDRSKSWDDFLAESDSRENVDCLPQVHNCKYDESFACFRRIDACLQKGCSVTLKNSDGLTPIHLVVENQIFDWRIPNNLFNRCAQDASSPDNLSHLHIACASGNGEAVEALLGAGANVDAATTKSFQWYKELRRRAGKISQCLMRIHVSANSTPLHVAVVFGRKKIVKTLLKAGASLRAVDAKGFTPIHLSVARSKGSNKIAKAVLGKPKKLVDVVTDEGLSHLHVAAFVGDAGAIEKLIRRGANVNQSVDLEVPDFLSRFAGKTPLQVATQISRYNVAKVVRVLIESGADIYSNDTLQCLMGYRDVDYDQYFYDSLMGEADVDYGHYFIDQLKLNENACEPIGSSGLTLLHVACSRFDVNWATELLDRGADVNARIRSDEDYRGRWKGYTPLHALIARRNFARGMLSWAADTLGKLLLDRGADVMIDSEDGTPLHLSYRVQMENVEGYDAVPKPHNPLWGERVPRWSLDYLTSLMFANQKSYQSNPTNADGLSHFHIFCMFDRTADKVERYLDRGVDIDLSTNPFSEKYPAYTGIHFALAHEAFRVVNLLAQSEANVNVESADGNTPLHFMVHHNLMDEQRDYVLELQTHGANLNAKNIHGQTPIDLLMTKRNFSLDHFEYLLERGSRISIASGRSSPGPTALIMQNAEDRMSTLRMFVRQCNTQTAMGHGYDAIAEVIRAETSSDDGVILAIGVYMDRVQQLVDLGFDVHRPYGKADTELRKSISAENGTAADLWLQLGADLNVCDLDRRTFNKYDFNCIRQVLAVQVYKMKILGLYVSRACDLFYYDCKREFSTIIGTEIGLELEKAETVKVTDNLTARAFLSETWAVLRYSRLPKYQRREIDKFFKRVAYVQNEFPNLCGLMMLQYKKALVRPKLVEPAKEVLVNECEIYLPDLCLECIIGYLCNDELKYLIKHSERTGNLCKRPRIK